MGTWVDTQDSSAWVCAAHYDKAKCRHIGTELFSLAGSLTQLNHPLGNLPLEDAFRSARVYTLPGPGVPENVARGLRGIPNRYSARRGGDSPTAEPAQLG